MSTIATAAREYASRPADERYPTPQAMIAAAVQQKEHSKEVTYNAKDLHVNGEQQTLQLESPKGAASFSHWSFGQLCRSLGAPAAYLRSIPARITADALNYGLKTTPPATDLRLLVEGANGRPEPQVRACTSDKYGRVWDSDLYGAMQRNIMQHDDRWTTPPTWSGEPAGAYRGDRDSFLILVNGGSIVHDPSLSNSPTLTNSRHSSPADGMFRGILVRNSEVGAASVTIEQILFRYICGNHMLWGAVTDQTFRRRHIGDNALRDTIRQITSIAHNWANASPAKDEAIIKTLIEHEIAHTKDAVIDELRKIGYSEEKATQAYDRCESTENVSPRSFWGIAQGTTRISQDAGYQDDRYILDQLAGKVLARGAKLVRV